MCFAWLKPCVRPAKLATHSCNGKPSAPSWRWWARTRRSRRKRSTRTGVQNPDIDPDLCPKFDPSPNPNPDPNLQAHLLGVGGLALVGAVVGGVHVRRVGLELGGARVHALEGRRHAQLLPPRPHLQRLRPCGRVAQLRRRTSQREPRCNTTLTNGAMAPS